MKHPFKPLVVLSVLCYSHVLHATDTPYQQATTTVTASRYQQDNDEVIPSITVINREDILTLQANNILDILSLQQGIDVARNGGTGTTTSVFMRGTNSNHVLVLINGMRVSSAFSGSFAWEHVPVAQIERIEIVRNSRVSYYGTDAIGGVINIITRSQTKLSANYTSGDYDTHNFDFAFGGRLKNSQYSVSLGSQKTDGFSATNSHNLFSFDPDKDGYENQNISINLNSELTSGVLGVNFLQTYADTDFDTGNSDAAERVATISWNNVVFDDWNAVFSIGNNSSQLDTLVFSSRFGSSRTNLDWLLNKQVENHHFGLGINYQTEQADFTNPNAPVVSFSENRNNVAAFANWQTSHGTHIFSFSGRFDHNSVYGNKVTTDMAWAKRLNSKNTLNFSAGTAFHAPSINELFSPNFQGIVVSPVTGEDVFAFAFEGNPDLKPEEAINYELGFKSRISETQNLSLNVFYYAIDDLIDFQGATFKPININKASIKGVEAAYDYQHNGLRVNLNATWQDAKNTVTDEPLLRRADKKLNFTIDKRYNQFSFGSSMRFASQNPDFGVLLDGYALLDVRVAFQLNKHWNMGLKIENVTAKNYQIINGFNTPKSATYFSLAWQQ